MIKTEETPTGGKGEEIQGDWTTANWDHHNGGVTEHYAWSQTPQDVELKLALPNPNIRASDLKIDIKPYALKVGVVDLMCFYYYFIPMKKSNSPAFPSFNFLFQHF